MDQCGWAKIQSILCIDNIDLVNIGLEHNNKILFKHISNWSNVNDLVSKICALTVWTLSTLYQKMNPWDSAGIQDPVHWQHGPCQHWSWTQQWPYLGTNQQLDQCDWTSPKVMIKLFNIDHHLGSHAKPSLAFWTSITPLSRTTLFMIWIFSSNKSANGPIDLGNAVPSNCRNHLDSSPGSRSTALHLQQRSRYPSNPQCLGKNHWWWVEKRRMQHRGSEFFLRPIRKLLYGWEPSVLFIIIFCLLTLYANALTTILQLKFIKHLLARLNTGLWWGKTKVAKHSGNTAPRVCQTGHRWYVLGIVRQPQEAIQNEVVERNMLIGTWMVHCLQSKTNVLLLRIIFHTIKKKKTRPWLGPLARESTHDHKPTQRTNRGRRCHELGHSWCPRNRTKILWFTARSTASPTSRGTRP